MHVARSTSTKSPKGNSQSESSSKTNYQSSDSKSQKKKRHTLFTEKIYLCLSDEKEPSFMKSFIKKGSNGFGICELCPPPIPRKDNNKRKVVKSQLKTYILTSYQILIL